MAGASKIERLPPWGSAVAGATGAVIANALVYPLDIVKTRLQVQVKKKVTKDDHSNSNGTIVAAEDDHHEHDHHPHYHSAMDAIHKIVGDEGVSGLYAGMAGSLLGVASTNFAYFYWYTIVRTFYFKYSKSSQHPGTAIELGLGAVAGALAQLFTIPVAVTTTRQQTQPKKDRKGFFETAMEVIEGEDGWRGLWRGLKASLVLVVNPAITYGAYQRLREMMFDDKKQLKAGEAFLLGALSKMMATIATQPLIVAKVGLQSRPPPSRRGKHFKGFVEVMAYIVEHEGLLGLFKGIGPQIVKGLLVQGFLMMTKERVELLFLVLFNNVAKIRQEQLKKLAETAAKAKVGGK
ncbi:mitochondrial carrier [Eremomyces bilateralis CBS 781.70]|uniref:Mitochondrial carrier n=1 Tax=Eremomyces bilateralis CBS 781.70 TaxID=1392243 RepID=A0A6G1G001_9PEZI|nr:mitochondrial carrier [Eremomyces bilateralis CBS 781.70]KAF1811250.1 mitochondrial carrier [Eremomyces bilateralis CBS 781.70]